MSKEEPKEKETLRSLLALSNDLVNSIVENEGALSPELEAQLLKIEVSVPAKIDAYSHIMERLETEAEHWKQKADFYASIARACNNTKSKIKENLKYAMISAGKTEVAGTDIKFRLQNTKPSLIIDSEKIDSSYKMQVVEWVIDKKRIEEDMKNGVKVNGATFESSYSLRAVANKKV